MSLNYLGLHRQLSSPKAANKHSRTSSSTVELAEDSKDVLIDRFSDLLARLSRPLSFDHDTISILHAEVDKIEQIVQSVENEGRSRSGSSNTTPERSINHEEDTFWGPPTPTRSFNMRLPQVKTVTQPNKQQAVDVQRALEIAKEAEDLASRLSTTIKELQERREEADHVHDLLVTRAESAAERILFLEYRLAEMEEDFEHNHSELKFLRIQMQAIETQASQYIPHDEDPELTQSIINWKVDWENIEKHARTKRKKHHRSYLQSMIDHS